MMNLSSLTFFAMSFLQLILFIIIINYDRKLKSSLITSYKLRLIIHHSVRAVDGLLEVELSPSST